MARDLKLADVRTEARCVVLRFETAEETFELPLAPERVGELVSMLYAAQTEALGIDADPSAGPENMLAINEIRFGTTIHGPVLRIYTSDVAFQDFVAPAGTNIASLFDQMAQVVATQTGETPVPFSPKQSN